MDHCPLLNAGVITLHDYRKQHFIIPIVAFSLSLSRLHLVRFEKLQTLNPDRDSIGSVVSTVTTNFYPQRHNKFSILPLIIAELEEEVGRKTESYQRHL